MLDMFRVGFVVNWVTSSLLADCAGNAVENARSGPRKVRVAQLQMLCCILDTGLLFGGIMAVSCGNAV